MKGFRIAAAAVAATLAIGSLQAQTISIGTSPVGSLNYSVGNALGKVLTDHAGLKARVVPFGGGTQTLPLINKQELEMAVTNATDALFAFQGKEEYQGLASPQLRVVGAVFPFYIGWFVKKDAPYKSLTDLKGKKVTVGYTTAPQQRRPVIAALAAEGLTEADFDGVPVPHVVRGADDFMQGKVEATSFAVGAGKVAEVEAKVGGIRYLNVPSTPEAVNRIKKLMPTAYVDVLKPSPAFVGVIGPTSLIFEDYVIVAGAHVTEEAAYKSAQVLHQHQAELAAVAKPYDNYDPKKLATDRGLPFHPGAIKYYKEKGIWSGK
jgi:uncharacterized protein